MKTKQLKNAPRAIVIKFRGKETKREIYKLVMRELDQMIIGLYPDESLINEVRTKMLHGVTVADAWLEQCYADRKLTRSEVREFLARQ